MNNKLSALLCVCAMSALVSACGGGGGGGSFTSPITPTAPPQAPTPTPTPTPPPSDFNTIEYRRSNAAVTVGALSAYAAGAFGAGVKVGVIDSGLNTTSAEFAGRVDPASRNLNTGSSLLDSDGHGTSVSAVIAAARNGSSVQGVAPEATLVVAKADSIGSCTGEDGCTFADADIATGIDIARQAGARVVNVSLGGSAAAPILRRAIDRATAADMIIVISSGNDGEDNPDPLSLVALTPEARGRVIIAGALTPENTTATFSNKAGSGRSHFFVTIGESVVSFDQTGDLFEFSGTSYAAPGISGALALLFSAFPNLTADEAIEILQNSARDLGAVGVDAEFGQGQVDIAAAFQAQGQTSLAGSKTPLANDNDPLAVFGGAAGDGGKFGTALGQVIVLDRYGRAYEIGIGDRVAARAALGKLIGPLLADSRAARAGFGPAALTLSLAGQRGTFASSLEAQALDARAGGAAETPMNGYVTGSPAKGVGAAFGYGVSPRTLLGTLAAGGNGSSWLASDQRLGDDGVISEGAAAVSQKLGAWTLGVAAGTGRSFTPSAQSLTDADEPSREEEARNVSRFALQASRTFGTTRLSLGYERLDEAGSFLGSRGSAVLGISGADSDFLSARMDIALADNLSFGANLQGGLTRLDVITGGLAQSSERLRSSGFAFELSRRDAFVTGDLFGLKLSQPLRIEGGDVTLARPTAYDYTARAPIFTLTQANLTPSGREIAVEAAYERAVTGGTLQANLFYRHEPGHRADLNADVGAAVRIGTRF